MPGATYVWGELGFLWLSRLICFSVFAYISCLDLLHSRVLLLVLSSTLKCVRVVGSKAWQGVSNMLRLNGAASLKGDYSPETVGKNQKGLRR